MLVVKLCVARFHYKCKKFGGQNNIVSKIFNTEIKSLIRDVIQSCLYFLLNGETNITCTTLHVKLHTSKKRWRNDITKAIECSVLHII